MFLYRGSPTGLSRFRALSAESDIAYTYLGNAVGPAGDVNGDEVGDVVVGAVQYNGNSTNCGAAFAWYGERIAPQMTETPTPTMTLTATATATPTGTPKVELTITMTPASESKARRLYLPWLAQD
jgi:hypothetical protein